MPLVLASLWEKPPSALGHSVNINIQSALNLERAAITALSPMRKLYTNRLEINRFLPDNRQS